MSVIDAREQARSSLVLALKLRRREGDDVRLPKPVSDQDRTPLVTSDDVTLDSALDDVIARFPKTLSYLAK
jgi:hypothetical protein